MAIIYKDIETSYGTVRVVIGKEQKLYILAHIPNAVFLVETQDTTVVRRGTRAITGIHAKPLDRIFSLGRDLPVMEDYPDIYHTSWGKMNGWAIDALKSLGIMDD